MRESNRGAETGRRARASEHDGPVTAWEHATPDEQLSCALSLLRRLAQSNLRSLQIAKQLMIAQDLAELRSGRAEWAIDHAADSGGDPLAIDSAVAAVAAAERAEADERALALSWAVHRSEVTKLTTLADELVGCGSPAGGRPASAGRGQVETAPARWVRPTP